MNKIHWVYDFETLSNCFVAVFIDYKSFDKKTFVIWKHQNDYKQLMKFFKSCIKQQSHHISFNGLKFDAQIENFLMSNYTSLKDLNGEDLARIIYQEAQDVIDTSKRNEFHKWSERTFYIPQIDVMSINHWDSGAKHASLKWVQGQMNYWNILDMPIKHNQDIHTKEELDTIINYCINDVESTKEIYNYTKSQLELRVMLSKTYKLNLKNASEPRLAKELFLHFMATKLKISKYELKQLRTDRPFIKGSDIVLNNIKFKNKVFTDVLNTCKQLKINCYNTKNAFKKEIRYKGCDIDYGLGGIHGSTKPGVYESDENFIIIDSDVVSFYPRLISVNKWGPAHLDGPMFFEIYDGMFAERLKYPKSNPWNYVYKILLNSTYGLTKDKNSFLYDPKVTFSTTINGQLLLSILFEDLCESVPGAQPLMINTDGCTIRIPRKHLNLYMQVCEKWEKLTNLNLEHDTYLKVFQPDVNNYIAIKDKKEITAEEFKEKRIKNPWLKFTVDGTNKKYYYNDVKCKGRFEFLNLPYHKNKSNTIVRKMVYNKFVKDIPFEKTMKSSDDIYDFAIYQRCNGDWKFKSHALVDNKIEEKSVQNTIRYIVAESGVRLLKVNTQDSRKQLLEAEPIYLELINQVLDIDRNPENYKLDYQYYFRQANKEYNNVHSNQISLL